MDGVLIIRKEKGYNSHDVVAKLRGILHMKKIGNTLSLIHISMCLRARHSTDPAGN